MHTLKQIAPTCVFVLLFVIASYAGTAQAKSVYVITDRSNTVTAYEIQGDQIEYQTAQNLPHHGDDAVGNAG